jgi:signal transduction histidine kinase/ActR/RegA family two-component response regulator
MMRATLESTTDGVLVTDGGGKVTDYNENYLQMWQIAHEVMPHADHRLLVLEYQTIKESDKQLARLDEIYASSPAETFDLLELEDGRVFERFSRIQRVEERNVGRVWSYRDITDRRRAEEALRDQRHILELLNRTGTLIASTLDLQTLVQAVTDAGAQLSGAKLGAFFYNTAETLSDVYRLYASAGAPRADIQEISRSLVTPLFGPNSNPREPIRCEDVQRDARFWEVGFRPNSSSSLLGVRSYLAVPVISRSGEVIGGLFFTHSDPGIFDERVERIIVAVAAQAAVAIDNARLLEAAQKAAEERENLLARERSARAAAERMGELKDEFLANLSHELRTPLSAIVGWSKVLRRGIKDEADLHNGLDTIERNARVQTQLIDDLLDMNRIASGKVRLDTQLIAPISFIEAAIDTVRPAAEAKGIQIEKILDSEAAPISGDPNRLQQVIWNLISNAIKFTARGGKVQVLLMRVDSHVEISVADTGIGINPEFQAHVFERFRQADASTNRKYGGLGLGLSIVKHLVELHGGTVRVESQGEGCGATFSVQLPLMEEHRKPSDEYNVVLNSMESDSIDFATVNLSGIKVLVVDDEMDARNLIRRVLADCHADVLTAASAGDALKLIENERPHVLVSDIGMPDVDGYELLKRVRSLDRSKGGRMPAIALTAFARSEDRTRALRAGFLVHVSKPVEPSELVASVASVTGRSVEQFE